MLSKLSKQCLQLASIGYEKDEIATDLQLELSVIEQAFLDARVVLVATDDTHAVPTALRRNLIQ